MGRRARTLSEKKSDAGRLGGITTMLRYGQEHYSRMAASRKTHGGPRRRETLEEIQALESAVVNEFEGSLSDLPNDLRELKRLALKKYGGGFAGSVGGAGTPGRS